MSIKKTYILLFFALLVFVLTACKREEGILRIALDLEDRDRYDELFDVYMERTGIEIRATYGEDIGKLIGTRDEPDIIKTSTVVVLAMKESLLDLTPLIENDPEFTTNIYIDSVMNALTIDDSVYALPTSINTSLLYYNRDLFDASADELREAFDLGDTDSVYPRHDWTLEDFKTAGVILTKYTLNSQGNPIYSQFGAETQLNWWGEWLVYVNMLGGSFYEEGSQNRKTAVTSDEVYQATEFFVQKSMGGIGEKFAPDALQSQGGFSFLSGNVAMVLGGHLGDWFGYDMLGLNWDIQVLPTPADNPNARGGEISADAFGISNRSQMVEEAFAFLKMWAGEEGALTMYQNGKIGALNNMQELIGTLPEEYQKDLDIEALFMAIERAETLPEEKDFSKVMREIVMGELYRLMFTGRGSTTDIHAVLETIKQRVDDYYINLYG